MQCILYSALIDLNWNVIWYNLPWVYIIIVSGPILALHTGNKFSKCADDASFGFPYSWYTVAWEKKQKQEQLTT